MGSVSSLISGHSFHSKHCRASQYKLRKSSHLKKLNRYSDGLLRFGFSQDSGHKSSSKSSKNEDFFYIKVSQKSHGSHRTDYTALGGGELGSQAGTSSMDFGTPTPQKLIPFPSQLEVATEKPAARPTAFKPVLPRSGAILHSSPEDGGHLSQQLHPSDKAKEQELKPVLYSGGLSDSGRNSMSSLPTHSTSSSYQLDPLVTPMGPISRFGGSAHNILQCAIIQDSNMMSLKALSFSDGGNKILNPGKAPHHHAAEKTTCIRSPISTDESTIHELEQKLLEREGELQELQSSFEEKEISSCQAYEEKQRRCKEELEGLKQKCNSKLKQTSQKTQRTQQVLHLQVFQLQQEKKQLREELENLMKEQNLLETKLRSYEKEKTSFAPALEETQWELLESSFPESSFSESSSPESSSPASSSPESSSPESSFPASSSPESSFPASSSPESPSLESPSLESPSLESPSLESPSFSLDVSSSGVSSFISTTSLLFSTDKSPVSTTAVTSPAEPPVYNQQNRDMCIIRISVEDNNGNVYKSILLTNQDKTPAVIQRAMLKHNLESDTVEDYELVQVISEQKELLIPANANVFYAMNSHVNFDFILRKKSAGDRQVKMRNRCSVTLPRNAKRGHWSNRPSKITL